MEINKIYCGGALDTMQGWPDKFIDCCVTSPPYWGLRNYGVEGQLGLEKTPEEYIAKMVAIFAEVKRVLKDDATLWLNMGDSYWNGGGEKRDGGHGFVDGGKPKLEAAKGSLLQRKSTTNLNLKPKDLCGIPWMLAFALRADGWWLRQDIIWHKPNPMPESVTDRCTKAHEYIFLMTKRPKYYYDADAIREECIESNASRPRMGQGQNTQYNQKRGEHKGAITPGQTPQTKALKRMSGEKDPVYTGRNKRSVWKLARGEWRQYCDMIWEQMERSGDLWKIPTAPYKEAHFATFPPKLIEPCILAGCPEWVCKKCGNARVRMVKPTEEYAKNLGGKGFSKKDWLSEGGGSTKSENYPSTSAQYKTTGWTDCGCSEGFTGGIVLDPFCGTNTTGMVAYENRRNYIGIEINAEYIKFDRAAKAKEKYTLFGDKP